MKRIPLLGTYDAGMLQIAMRVVIAKFHLRQLRRQAISGSIAHCRSDSFDLRPNGNRVAL